MALIVILEGHFEWTLTNNCWYSSQRNWGVSSCRLNSSKSIYTLRSRWQHPSMFMISRLPCSQSAMQTFSHLARDCAILTFRIESQGLNDVEEFHSGAARFCRLHISTVRCMAFGTEGLDSLQCTDAPSLSLLLPNTSCSIFFINCYETFRWHVNETYQCVFE